MKKTSILAAALFALFAFPMFAEEPKEKSSDVTVETEGNETADATDKYIAFSDDEEKPAESHLFASKEDEED